MPRPKLSHVSVAALERELARRRAALPKLIAERDALSRKIAELGGQVVAEAPAAPEAPAKKAAPKKRRARRRRSGPRLTLKDALTQALTGKEAVSIPEATEAIAALGYKSRSKNLQYLVKQTLYHGESFKRVGKALFALK